METETPRRPIPWFGLILTFILCTIALVSLCLAILDPSRMELIQAPRNPSMEVLSSQTVPIQKG